MPIGNSWPQSYPQGPTAQAPQDSQEVARVISAFAQAVRAAQKAPEADQGGTYALPGECASRYLVGGMAASVVLTADCQPHEALALALAFAEDNKARLAKGFGLGFWRDSSTGRVWLDVSWSFHSVGAALTAAHQAGEIAIWDSLTGQSHNVREG